MPWCRRFQGAACRFRSAGCQGSKVLFRGSEVPGAGVPRSEKYADSAIAVRGICNVCGRARRFMPVLDRSRIARVALTLREIRAWLEHAIVKNSMSGSWRMNFESACDPSWLARIAKGSLSEFIDHIGEAEACGYTTPAETAELIVLAKRARGAAVGLIPLQAPIALWFPRSTRRVSPPSSRRAGRARRRPSGRGRRRGRIRCLRTRRPSRSG